MNGRSGTMSIQSTIVRYLFLFPLITLGTTMLLSCWSEFDDAYDERWDRTEKIVFTSYRDGNGEIYMMNADGSNETRLTFDASDDIYPSFAPDGSRIVFSSNRDGDYDLYTMNADGSNLVKITNGGTDGPASWSPDGNRIAFERIVTQQDIFVINIDGSGETNITQFPANPDGHVHWSPDGSRLVFAVFFAGTPQIYIMNPDGTGLTAPLTSMGGNSWPVWSPDGARIVFQSNRDGNNEIYIMNADGSGQRRLTIDTASDELPVFGSILHFL